MGNECRIKNGAFVVCSCDRFHKLGVLKVKTRNEIAIALAKIVYNVDPKHPMKLGPVTTLRFLTAADWVLAMAEKEKENGL